MAEKNKETAEQKLLKMIEDTSDEGATKKSEESVTRKTNIVGGIKFANKFLILGVIASVLMFANELMAGMAIAKKGLNFTVATSSTSSTMNSSYKLPKPPRLSYYLSRVKQRNIFQPYEKPVMVVQSNDDNRQIARKITSLKLVGVSWLDSIDSASVMIEDMDKEETYFLKKDQKIGDIFVKTIYADSAVLGYENEEITIRYENNQM